MLLTPEQRKAALEGGDVSKAGATTKSVWPNAVLPYTIDQSLSKLRTINKTTSVHSHCAMCIHFDQLFCANCFQCSSSYTPSNNEVTDLWVIRRSINRALSNSSHTIRLGGSSFDAIANPGISKPCRYFGLFSRLMKRRNSVRSECKYLTTDESINASVTILRVREWQELERVSHAGNDARGMAALRAGMKLWTDSTCVSFKPRTNERNYADFYIGTG